MTHRRAQRGAHAVLLGALFAALAFLAIATSARIDSADAAPHQFDLAFPADASEVGSTPLLVWQSHSVVGQTVTYEVLIDGQLAGEVDVAYPGIDESLNPGPNGRPPEIILGTVWFVPQEPLSPGEHTWTVAALDEDEERTDATSERTFEVQDYSTDVSAPTAPILSAPDDGGFVSQANPYLEWGESVDESGIARYELFIDDELLGQVPPDRTNVELAEGDLPDREFTWRVDAIDRAGNRAQSETRTAQFDYEEPIAPQIIWPVSAHQVGANPVFLWVPAADERSGIDGYELQVMGPELADPFKINVEGDVTHASLPESLVPGIYAWTVRAFDVAGNTSATSHMIFTTAADAPSDAGIIDAVSPAPGSATNDPSVLEWADVSGTLTVYIDGVNVGQGSEGFFHPEFLEEGRYTWYAVGSGAVVLPSQFLVDRTPPEGPMLVSPEDQAITVGEQQIAWAFATDPPGEGGAEASGIGGYRIYANDELVGEVDPETSEFTLPGEVLDQGNATWAVTAVDRAGNETSSEIRNLVLADPPEIGWEFMPFNPGAGEPIEFRPTLLNSSSPIVSYDWDFNGDGVVDRSSSTPDWFTYSYATPGDYQITFTATDSFGLQSELKAHITVFDRQPAGNFEFLGPFVEVGSTVNFNASGSQPPERGEIVKYEWDLNGDGTFELSSSQHTATRVYHDVEDVMVRLAVTDSWGGRDVQEQELRARLPAPPGPVGVSINDGAIFTNDPDVTIQTVWPRFSKEAVISNDGGFRGADVRDVQEEISWRLNSSGPERLPKTIYVRFRGGPGGAETYQDDIILDQTPPEVVGAFINDMPASTASAVSSDVLLKSTFLSASVKRRPTVRRPRVHMMRLRARDHISGVQLMQVAQVGRGRTKWVRYRPRVPIRGNTRRVFIRVLDRAGNPSRWKRAVSKRQLVQRRRAMQRRRQAR